MTIRAKLLAAVLLAAPAGFSQADVLLLDGVDQSRSVQQTRPARGTSMQAVEARFGSPTTRRSAVGDPPITRWEYPGFTVFFEYQYVIHAVARR